MSFDVAFIVGSKTDLPTIEESKMFGFWDNGGINWVADVISADRNPGVLQARCGDLLKEGVKVFGSAAGMAARLPGTIAGHLKHFVPVIGVALSSPEFPDGLDATLSIIRPPAGCPVGFAGVGIKGLRNAAVFIAQMLTNKPESQLVSIVARDENDCRAMEEADLTNILTQCKVNWEQLTWRQGDPSDPCQGMMERGVRICIVSLRTTNLFKEKLIFPNFSPLMISLPLPSDGFPNVRDALEVLVEPPVDWPVVSTGIGKAGLRNAALLTAQILAASDSEKGKETREGLASYYNANRKEPQIGYRKNERKGV